MPWNRNERSQRPRCTSPGPRGNRTPAFAPRSARASCGNRTRQRLQFVVVLSMRNSHRRVSVRASGDTKALTDNPANAAATAPADCPPPRYDGTCSFDPTTTTDQFVRANGPLRNMNMLSVNGFIDGRFRTFEDTYGDDGVSQVGELYRQIGQLKVENDFLARRLGKEAGPSVAR